MLKYFSVFFTVLCTVVSYPHLGFSEEAVKEAAKEPPKERTVETHHKATINGVSVPYTATAGIANLKGADDKVVASLFYVAYTREDVDNKSSRPVTFCFNGGPGSASIWLHMGVLGPQRVQTNGEGAIYQPYRAIDNAFSILDKTDLVFIDPITTGYSRPATGQENKQFQGYNEDIKYVADFIHLYIARNGRWESPKLLAGESYGTVRAIGLASYLTDTYYMPMNGIILVSSVLDYGLRDGDNDFYYPLILPSYTSVAGVHKKLAPELLNDMSATLKEVEEFANGEYLLALMKGDKLPEDERERVIDKLSRYTGLSPAYLRKANMRVEQPKFCKELLSDSCEQVGRFDGRIKGYDVDATKSCMEYDPSMSAIDGGFTAIFNQYLRQNLQWDSDDQYVVLNHSSRGWNYGDIEPFAFSVVPTLRELLVQTHDLNIFVASGYQDLATPFYAAHYTFNHLHLNPKVVSRIYLHDYEGGHMMYLYQPVLEQLKRDFDQFIDQTIDWKQPTVQKTVAQETPVQETVVEETVVEDTIVEETVVQEIAMQEAAVQ